MNNLYDHMNAGSKFQLTFDLIGHAVAVQDQANDLSEIERPNNRQQRFHRSQVLLRVNLTNQVHLCPRSLNARDKIL